MILFFIIYCPIIFVALCLLVFLLLRAERRTGVVPHPHSKSTPLGGMTYRQVNPQPNSDEGVERARTRNYANPREKQ